MLEEGFSQTTMAVIRILSDLLPKPFERLFSSAHWTNSVLYMLDETNQDVKVGMKAFRRQVLAKSLVEYLYEIVEKDPHKMILCSSSTNMHLSIERSIVFLRAWLNFQFGTNAITFVNNIITWLKRSDFKKGGFLVEGPANAGKSFIMQALCNLFVFVGHFNQSTGYAFNFDDCRHQQLILAEDNFGSKRQRNHRNVKKFAVW